MPPADKCPPNVGEIVSRTIASNVVDNMIFPGTLTTSTLILSTVAASKSLLLPIVL